MKQLTIVSDSVFVQALVVLASTSLGGVLLLAGREQTTDESAVPEVIRAGSFVLVDAHGEDRARLACDESGVVLTMGDPARPDTFVRIEAGPSVGRITLAGGEEPFGVVTLLASDQGSSLSASWNDQADFGVFTTEKGARMGMETYRGPMSLSDGQEPLSSVELRSSGERGELVLIGPGAVETIRAPDR